MSAPEASAKTAQRVNVVLDVFVEDNGDTRVVMVGVFEPGATVPERKTGAFRNSVQTWVGVEHNVRAFCIGPTADAEQ